MQNGCGLGLAAGLDTCTAQHAVRRSVRPVGLLDHLASCWLLNTEHWILNTEYFTRLVRFRDVEVVLIVQVDTEFW